MKPLQESIHLKASPVHPVRFLYVDGLRGVAAMAVVFYHLVGNLEASSSGWIPQPFLWLSHQGNLGVDVFFVLSGFVIAHSIRNAEPSWRYLGRFGLRRSIRLDPPLWVTIALELALLRFTIAFFPAEGATLPGLGTIVANLTYTQELLGIPNVVEVFWSLTYEVQFYVVLVGALVVLHKVIPRRVLTIARIILGVSLLYSLLIWSGILPLPHRGLFIQRWFQFGLGVLAWAAAHELERPATFWAWCGVSLMFVLALDGQEYRQMTIVVAVATAGSLYLAAVKDRMGDWLAGPTIQFLGRISYSLYLLHAPIGWRVISFFRVMAPEPLGPVFGTLVFVGAVGASILASWILYRLVEAPSMTFARKIRLPKAVR